MIFTCPVTTFSILTVLSLSLFLSFSLCHPTKGYTLQSITSSSHQVLLHLNHITVINMAEGKLIQFQMNIWQMRISSSQVFLWFLLNSLHLFLWLKYNQTFEEYINTNTESIAWHPNYEIHSSISLQLRDMFIAFSWQLDKDFHLDAGLDL
jgi:hypothetical protein